MAAFVFNTPLMEETEMTSDQEYEDDVSIPDYLTEEKKEWFTHFVIWQRKTYRSLGSKLDPDKVHLIEPTSEKEARYLNFFMFHDKYMGKRCDFETAEQWKKEYSHMVCPGTDHDFHRLASMFTQLGPGYFKDNSDVKGKTQEELELLKERPWRPYPTYNDDDCN